MRTAISLILVAAAAADASASTWYVATTGNDSAAGSAAAPFRTIQRAVTAAGPGDTVSVKAGTYVGFQVTKTATAAAPVKFVADGVVNIDGAATSDRDAIHVESSSYVVIEGFTVTHATRSGISSITSDHITIRGNKVDQNAKWGIFTAFTDDLLVENNEASRSGSQHGIYASNSADNPVIRGNRIWGNAMCGIHMNGDLSQGGDGVITNALVENNIIYDNGALGGSAINGDGVKNAVIRNNVLDNNHASGISLYQIDGGQPSTGNKVINNTVRMASNARSAVNIQDGSTNNTLRNNILLDPAPNKGAIDICNACKAGMVSEHNAVVGKFVIDGNMIDLPTWRTRTGLDATSFVATDADLFTSATDLTLKAGSMALDMGVATDAPATDVIGTPRPQGTAVDIGAYERCTGTCGGGSGSGGGDGNGDGTGDGTGDGSDTGSGSDDGSGSDGPDYSGPEVDDGSGGCNAGGGSGLVLALGVFGAGAAMGRRKSRS